MDLPAGPEHGRWPCGQGIGDGDRANKIMTDGKRTDLYFCFHLWQGHAGRW